MMEVIPPNLQQVWTTKNIHATGSQKSIECATEQYGDDTCNRMQATVDSQGEQASVALHKNCHCSLTSKDHVKRDSYDASVVRIRRLQLKDFDLNIQYLFCAKPCEPVNHKHPDRWDRVVQCETKSVKDAPAFKAVVM